MNTAYDLILTRDADGVDESYGFIVPWSHNDPVQVLRSKPQVNADGGTGRVGGILSARDAPPPYPVEYTNWKGGCGQRSLDWEDSVAKQYWDSRGIDVRKRGNIELGPYRHFSAYPDILGPCIEALGTIWCGFEPVAGEGPHNALRYLSSSVLHLDDFLLQPAYEYADIYGTWAGNDYVLIGDTEWLELTNAGVGNEVVIDGHTFVVKALITVPANADHDTPVLTSVAPFPFTEGGYYPDSTYVRVRGFVPVDRGADDDDLYVKALCTDGGKVYAAFGDYIIDGEEGYVVSGTKTAGWGVTASETDFYANVGNITSLTYSGGYIYGVQTRFGTAGSEKTVVGSFAFGSGSWGFTALSASGGVYPETEDVGLATLGNWVYWLVSGEDQGWLYKVQRSGDPSFSLVDTLPHDFNPTCILSHLGFIYIGGFVDTGTTWLNDPEKTRYTGALYTLIGDTVTLLTSVGLDADADYRVAGLQGSERFIYVLTQDDVYIWDAQEGALSHLMPVDGGTAFVQGSDQVDWVNGGYDYEVSTESVSPNQNENDSNARPNGDGWFTFAQDNCNWVRTVTSDKWLHMRVDHNQYAHISRYDSALTGACTVEFKFKDPEFQGGEVWVADDERLVRVNIKGLMSKKTVHNKVVWSRAGSYVSLAYQKDTATGSDISANVQWKRSAKLSTAEHVVRIVLNSAAALVYIDGKLGLQVDRESLPFITGTFGQGTGQRVSIFTGWYHNAQSGSQRNKWKLKYFKYTADGAYNPGYKSAWDLVTLGSFAVQNGTIYVPAPAKGMQVAAPTTVAGDGWLETSESAYKMPSIKKTFSSVEIDLPVSNDFIGAVNLNQRILTTVFIDGKPVTLDPIVGPQPNLTHFVLPITGSTTKGYKVSVRIALEDGTWDDEGLVFTPTVYRSPLTRLRVSSITVKFFINGGARQYKMKLDLTGAAEVRDTQPRQYDEDPQYVADWLFDQTGELLTMDMVGREGVLVHLDEVDLRQMTPDKKRYLGIRGYATIIMTEVDPTNVELLAAEDEEE